jgi:hypothetical protein
VFSVGCVDRFLAPSWHENFDSIIVIADGAVVERAANATVHQETRPSRNNQANLTHKSSAGQSLSIVLMASSAHLDFR